MRSPNTPTVSSFLACALVAGAMATVHAATPAGLDSRANLVAYVDNKLPTSTVPAMPALLSQTGVYTSLVSRTPHTGLIPYSVNSALWTDGAAKSRYIGLPYDGTAASPKIGFAATGAWTFPAGSVFVKNFDLTVDERANAVNPVRRLETRILVRLAAGTIRGATYRWRADNSDADLVSTATNETITITQPNNTTRTQTWLYPSPGQCVLCHNADAGMVLGVRTAQQNGNVTYAATGRTDNQLHTWAHLDMFNQNIDDPPTGYTRMYDVMDTSVPMETRVKSYQEANCAHCHRPNGTRPFQANGPLFDMRFEAPILAPSAGRISIVANSGTDGLVRRNIANSSIHQRDGSTDSFDQMPPLARDVPDQRILDLYVAWVNYAYDVLSVTRLSATSLLVKFDRAVETGTANVAGNYALSGGVTISQAVRGVDPSEVVLTTSTLAPSTNYTLTVNRVKEEQAPQNPIWPNTVRSFSTPAATVPGAPTITVAQAGNAHITVSFTPPATDGGALITTYRMACTPSAATVDGPSPLTLAGLTNGTMYSCTVRAINSVGQSAQSNAVSVTPQAPVTIALTAVKSRKTHTGQGAFDVDINPAIALGGTVSVESRMAGSGHRVVFVFNENVTARGTATVVDGAMQALQFTASHAANEIEVVLANVAEASRARIVLTGVNGGSTEYSASLGFLVGDVNGTGRTTASDIAAIKANLSQPANSLARAKLDLNGDGTITPADVSAAKARAGVGVP
jgi:mono/diheme cytochrome c family protein